MAKVGRKHKPGERYPSGGLKPEAPQMALQRRAEILGVGLPANSKNLCAAEFGRSTGILYARGIISWAEKEAGERLRGAWLRFKAYGGIPSRNIRQPGKANHFDPEWEDFEKAQAEYLTFLYTACAGAKSAWLAEDLLNAICFADDLGLCPFLFNNTPNGASYRRIVKDSLAALAKHLSIGERE